MKRSGQGFQRNNPRVNRAKTFECIGRIGYEALRTPVAMGGGSHPFPIRQTGYSGSRGLLSEGLKKKRYIETLKILQVPEMPFGYLLGIIIKCKESNLYSRERERAVIEKLARKVNTRLL